MNYILSLLLFITITCSAQQVVKQPIDVPVSLASGKEDAEYTIATQMQYPATLLKKKVKENVIVYFTVTEKNELKNIHCNDSYLPEFKAEAFRLIKYIKFNSAKLSNKNVETESSFTISFSPELYKKYCKTRGFTIPKNIASYDTSSTINEYVDVYPQYIKGEEALAKYIYENLDYPEIAIKQGLQGTVLLNFVIEKTGTISNITVEKEFNHFCTESAIKLMRYTKWIPAQKNGKLVRVKTQYPITFNLRNISNDHISGEQKE